MPVEKVTTYKTSDGSLFEDAVKAREHERETAAHNAIMEFAESVVFPGMDASDLAEALEGRGHEIGLKVYNKLYALPRVIEAQAFRVKASNEHGCMTFRIIVDKKCDEDSRDKLIDMYIAKERKRNAGLVVESVVPESGTVVIGVHEL